MHMKMVAPGMKIRVEMQPEMDIWIVLRYAHENGCHWDEDTCSGAAEKGQLECLRYARENGCHWDEDTCRYAAEYGNLDCLHYAHENGCPGSHNYKHHLEKTD